MKKLPLFGSMSCLGFLLCSFKPTAGAYYSILAKTNISVADVLKKYDPSNKQTVMTTSNTYNDEVGHVFLNYEILSQAKATEMYSGFIPVYLMLYEADVYLNNNVHNKGGFGGWRDLYEPAFIDELKLSFTFKGVNSIRHSYCTPSIGDAGDSSGIRFLKGVDLNGTNNGADLYKDDTNDTSEKLTSGNCFSEGGNELKLDWMEKVMYSIYSTSYCWEASSMKPENLDSFDSKLAVKFSSSTVKSTPELTFTQDFLYNQRVSVINNGDVKKVVVGTNDNIFSGPIKDDSGKLKPMYFSFFGVCAIQSDDKPTSIDVSMSLDTTYGCHEWLCVNEASSHKYFQIKLKDD
jgi:hypothetical protein